MNQIAKKIVYAIIIVSLTLTLSAQAVNISSSAKLLPAETVLLIEVKDFKDAKEKFEKTSYFKLYKDPQMAPFFSSAKVNFFKSIASLDENNLLKNLVDAEVTPIGNFTFALILDQRTKDFDQPPAIIISQWGDNIGKIKDTIKKLLQKNLEMGGSRKAPQNYRGEQIETVIDEAGSEFFYTFIDDAFIASFDRDTLNFTIAHLKGASSPSLANDSDYNSAIRTVGPAHDIDIFVNTKQFIKTYLSEPEMQEDQLIIKNLGLDTVTAIASAVALAPMQNVAIHSKAFVKINGSKKGILKLLDLKDASMTSPQFIPASAYSVSAANIDFQNVFNVLSEILNSFSPMYASFLYAPLTPQTQPDQPPVSLKADIIDNLGSQIFIAQTIKKPIDPKNNIPQSIIAIAANNPQGLENALARIHASIDAGDSSQSKREYLGNTIYRLNVPNLPFFLGQNMPMVALEANQAARTTPSFAFTVTDTHLILGLENSIETALRTLKNTPAENLNNQPWFKKAKTALPYKVGFAGMENRRISTEFIWKMMKLQKNALGQHDPKQLQPQDIMNPESIVDFSLLPEFEKVASYFGLSAYYASSRPNGIFFELKEIDQ